MAAGIANPLRMGIFSIMNNEKAHDSLRADTKERGLVSILQMKNSASEAMELAHGHNGRVANCLNGMSESIKDARETSKIFNGVCKGVNVVSDWVNPILVVASGVRVYNADDKQSALLKEAGAMSCMFAAEGFTKKMLGLNKGTTAQYKNYKFMNDIAEGVKKFCANTKYLKNISSNRIGGVLKGLAFIVASCGGFEIGSRIGKAIADETTAKSYAEKHALAKQPTDKDATKEFVS